MTPLQTTCAICNTTFEARTSYGLCPACYSKDRLREWDRLQSAIKYAHNVNVPADLSLIHWLAVLSDFRGCCAFCEQTTYSFIETMNPVEGLTWHNVVPACRACSYHKRNGFEVARLRVQQYLTANANRTEDDINLEFLYEDDDHEPSILGPMPEWMQRSPIFKDMKVTQENIDHA